MKNMGIAEVGCLRHVNSALQFKAHVDNGEKALSYDLVRFEWVTPLNHKRWQAS